MIRGAFSSALFIHSTEVLWIIFRRIRRKSHTGSHPSHLAVDMRELGMGFSIYDASRLGLPK
jgi:hypothetical protein